MRRAVTPLRNVTIIKMIHYVTGTNCIIFTSFPASSSRTSPKKTPFSVHPEPSLACDKQQKEVKIGMSRVRVGFLFFRGEKKKVTSFREEFDSKEVKRMEGLGATQNGFQGGIFILNRKLREQKGFIFVESLAVVSVEVTKCGRNKEYTIFLYIKSIL